MAGWLERGRLGRRKHFVFWKRVTTALFHPEGNVISVLSPCATTEPSKCANSARGGTSARAGGHQHQRGCGASQQLREQSHFHGAEKAPSVPRFIPRHGGAEGDTGAGAGCHRQRRGRASSLGNAGWGHASRVLPWWHCTSVTQQGEWRCLHHCPRWASAALSPGALGQHPGPHAGPGSGRLRFFPESTRGCCWAAALSRAARCAPRGRHPSGVSRCERLDGWTDGASSGAAPSTVAGRSPQPCQGALYFPGFHLPPSWAGCWAQAAELPVMGHGCPHVADVPVPGCPLCIRLSGQPRLFSVRPARWAPGGKTRVTQSDPFQEAASWGSGDTSVARAGTNSGVAVSLGWTHQEDSLEELNRRTTPSSGWHHFLPPGQLIGPGLRFSLPCCRVWVPPSEVGANGCTLKGSFPLAEQLRKWLARPAAPRRTALPRPCGATGGPSVCWQVGVRPRSATTLLLARPATPEAAQWWGPPGGRVTKAVPSCAAVVSPPKGAGGGDGDVHRHCSAGDWCPMGESLCPLGRRAAGRRVGRRGCGLGLVWGPTVEGQGSACGTDPAPRPSPHPPQRSRAGCCVLVQRCI